MSERTLTNQTLGRYQLLVAVARGGMGQVWLGRLQGARGFNKLVAVKTLLTGELDTKRLESMLQEEARIASMIQHANVVHTIELGEHEGLLYLVMEWVDGEPLGFLLSRAAERGGVPVGIAAALVSQVLAGLHAAHELSDHSGPLGVVHRDVSPHNILVTYNGVAKLLDFGVAKATLQTSSNTETGEVKGKFSYMAPEQILGGEVDRRCDIFAAGIVLYFLSTGRHPFKHANTAAVIHSITTDDPVAPPSSFLDHYPAELEYVVMKALEKDVKRRWATAEDMRVALERAIPDAFDDEGDAALRAFMERMLGDRKVARREAVRRAQLAADARDVETGARKALQVAAQSASSLRAISISQPAPEDDLEDSREPVSEKQLTLRAPPKKRRIAKGPLLAAIGGLALAVAVVLPKVLDHSPAPVEAASPAAGPPAAGEAAPAAPEPAPVVTPPAPATPPESAAEKSASPVVAPSAGSAVRRGVTPGKRKLASASKKSAPAKIDAREELLAPDYAR
ncbi:MAG TPA: serine/threonine-protein kinase [Polyangiaceae bacterium]|nr:serine/threonine-protein kinase [Polyangiaceae bacterium]